MEQVFPFPEGKFKYQFHSQISATHAVCKFHYFDDIVKLRIIFLCICCS